MDHLSKIILIPFQLSWSKEFAYEKERLERALNPLQIALHHIGSTSIAGCFAKPIIDILGVIPDITLIDSYNDKMIELQYIPRGEFGIPGRRFFSRSPVDTVHLHVFGKDHPDIERHLRFCAYLRKYPSLVRDYSNLKKSLAK